MTLKTTQQQFIEAVFDPSALELAILYIESDARLTAKQRLGIYRNSAHGVLLQHLKAVFNVTEQLVGADFFEWVVDQYVDHHPPTSPSLPAYGATFATYLTEQSALESMLWIAELAQLEWARHAAWHGVNQDSSDFAQLAQLTPEQQLNLTLYLPHTATLIHSTYALHEIWVAHQADANPDALEQLQLNQPNYLLIWRDHKKLWQQVLTREQYEFLYAIQSESNLNQLAQQFADALPQLLSHALQQGWIRSFKL